MLTVRIFYTNGTEEIKDCWDLLDICLDGVESVRIIRNEKAA